MFEHRLAQSRAARDRKPPRNATPHQVQCQSSPYESDRAFLHIHHERRLISSNTRMIILHAIQECHTTKMPYNKMQ